MSLEHILAAIEDETAAQVAQIESESLREATAILDKALTQVRSLEAEAASARDDELLTAAARHRNQARIQASTHLMHTREAVYQRVAQEARDRLAALRDQESYPSILRLLLEEALAVLPAIDHPHQIVIRTDPQDADQASRILAEMGVAADTVSLDPSLETWGGVEVASDDGRIVARNTLEARMERAEPHLRRLVAEAIPAMAVDGTGTGR